MADLSAEVGGQWSGSRILIESTGGECLGPKWATSIGETAHPFEGSIDQTGTLLTGSFLDRVIGITCSYSGTVSRTGFVLTSMSCPRNPFNDFSRVPCEGFIGDARLRDQRMAAVTFSADVNARTATGTMVETWNVFVSGTSTQLADLMFKWTVTMKSGTSTP
jgi:hypothetical protein